MANFIGKLKVLSFLLLTKPRVLYFYRILLKNELRPLPELERVQILKLIKYLRSAHKHVPHFKEILRENQLSESNIFESMDKIEILTKAEITARENAFLRDGQTSSRWKAGRTGGSTGTPLRYWMTQKYNDMGFAILYRGWGRGGYKIGDRLAVLAGGSLVEKKISLKTRVISYGLNLRKYSSYGVDEALFMAYYKDMLSWQPKFLQGYVSAIYEYAKFVERHALSLKFYSIFTTAEMLLDNERALIERVFKCKVHNTYGLNDGGVSAFECRNGSMHIDLERAYLEVVDEAGRKTTRKNGRIVATSFLNEATFFVRYDTGDLGEISTLRCSCGSPYPILAKLTGRKTDVLCINNKILGSPVLTVLMSNIPVNRYQFIQKNDGLVLKLEISDKLYQESHEKFIVKSLTSQFGEFSLDFEYNPTSWAQTENGKHKVVVRL